MKKNDEAKNPVRNKRIQRLKRESQTPPNNSNSPSSASLPVTAVLAAAGVAAIGIAAAGVTATSELFETSPEKEQTSYTSQLYEEPKSTSRFGTYLVLRMMKVIEAMSVASLLITIRPSETEIDRVDPIE
jgi:uroporphyrinogen-III decarboxylase